jgi:hypothetical protein
MNQHFIPRSPAPTANRPTFAGLVRRVVGFALALLAAALLVVPQGRAAGTPQSGRFLLIFETSSALKKNLAWVRQTLGDLFASNLQTEIQDNDDLAVWTVDESLHPGQFPLASWDPDDAAMYGDRLSEFLGQQKYSRHVELAAVQPLLNRVAKNSERLTVLIFCTSQSRLLGTPYDSGVNETITNMAAKLKGRPIPLLLVLRSYHGEYLGCSVNRSVPLNFPKFPPPPPEPAPVTNPSVTVAPPPAVRPAAPAVPPLIIVGANAGTNLAAAAKPAATIVTTPPPAVVTAPAPTPPPVIAPSPPPATATAPPPATNAVAANATPPATFTNPAPISVAPPLSPAVEPAPKVVPPPPANPAPVTATTPPPIQSQPPPAKAPPVMATTLQAPPTSTPPPAMMLPPERVASNLPPATGPKNLTGAAVDNNAVEGGFHWGWVVVVGVVATAVLAISLGIRARRPRSSLITSTMRDDPRWPPRK